MLHGIGYKKIYKNTLRLNTSATAYLNPKRILQSKLFALMREDASARKVYYLPLQDTVAACQPVEHLLYDFSLLPGDTLNACVLDKIYASFLTYVPRVDSIRAEPSFGQLRRAFYTKGVFVNEGLLFDSPGTLLEGFGYALHGLLNFGRKGPLVRFDDYCEGAYANCGFTTALAELADLASPLVFSPNPATHHFRLQTIPSAPGDVVWRLGLFNASGRLVLQRDWSPSESLEVEVDGLPAGVYHLWLDDGQRRWSDVLVLVPR